MSFPRTNDGPDHKVEPSTGGAAEGRDLGECVAGYFIQTGESTYHTLDCQLLRGHQGPHFDRADNLFWARPWTSQEGDEG
jgi:hypothetical protein